MSEARFEELLIASIGSLVAVNENLLIKYSEKELEEFRKKALLRLTI